MDKSAHVVWFKRDLRIHDHAPLLTATNAGKVILLYIVEPTLWEQPDSSSRHWHFIYDSLLDLNYQLHKCGGKLTIRIADALSVFESLRKNIGSFTLWSHEETGNAWSYARDLAVKKWCNEHNITWHEFPSNGVVRCLKSRDGWAKLRDVRMADTILPAPKSIELLTNIESSIIPKKHDPLFGSIISRKTQTGGRTEGLTVLNSFLKERGRKYMQTISKPGPSAQHCSRLSPHIAYGTLSIREIEQATKKKIEDLSSSKEEDAFYFSRNLSAFLSRLAWRCHFVQKLEQQPDIETCCMHPAFEGMRENAMRPDYFEAWKTGTTGYPIVDACMRSLIENGWITFRMRAMLVSFASYHLWLDWRQTAPYLAKLFTDYEPGIHYSQFQMQSGVTGINAVRMYSPNKQSIEHDPEGNFIRRYVPELKDVPTSFIHEPSLLENPPMNYPKPIVEHSVAIKYARQQIAERWHQTGFKEEAKNVHRKLGSRNSRTSLKQIKKPTHEQLYFKFK